MKSRRPRLQLALVVIVIGAVSMPLARAQDSPSGGYVSRKEYEELKEQLVAMKKELDSIVSGATTFSRRRALVTRNGT
jgi:hypothetical protein